MSAGTQTLKFEQSIEAAPSQVYYALTNATALREWLCDIATVNPKPEGRLYLAWNDGYYTSGEYLITQPGEKVAFSWQGRGEPGRTEIHVTLASHNGGTLVGLEHCGFGSGPEWEKPVQESKAGWEFGLKNLAFVLESGQDQRFVRRPMLGITIDDFNEEIAQQKGIPVSQGVRLDRVVEGMGAEAAGLQQGDVLVKIAGHEVSDWGSLAASLQKHYAGDQVEVVFYRGPELKTITMELSARPMPEIPSKPEELAKALNQTYTSLEGELDRLFEGVSEEEASHRPDPEEWSAKEIMAHLIHSERGWHSWINDLIGGQEPHYDDYGGNLTARVEATASAYPKLADLRQEYRRNCAETVALLSKLPPGFMARKGSYWRLAYNVLEAPYHFNSHQEQMRAAIESARSS